MPVKAKALLARRAALARGGSRAGAAPVAARRRPPSPTVARVAARPLRRRPQGARACSKQVARQVPGGA